MWIDWLDLPKLTSLRTNGKCSFTFRYPHHITLESDSRSLWMMFRHAQSYRCVSSICIRLQGWRHNQRKYSLHPSLTNRHWGSSTLLQLITERWMNTLCATSHSSSCETPLSLRIHFTHILTTLVSNEINCAESLEQSFQFILQNHLKSIHLPFSSHMHSVLS